MKKEIKRQVNRTAKEILFYSLIMVGVTFIYTMIKSAVTLMDQKNTASAEQIMEAVQKNVMEQAGWLSIAGVAVGILYLAFRHRKDDCIREMNRQKNKMDFYILLQILSVFMSCQVLFTAAAALCEAVLNPMGYTLSGAAQSASALSSTFSMFLYTTLIGPISEELVFRGFVMKSLLPYGKGLAIVVSSVLFGVIHGNFLQGFFAVGAGLVLGYTAVEYSLRWSIVIHILNNMVFSELLGRFTGQLPESAQMLIEIGISALFFAAACVILIRNRKKAGIWTKANRPGKRACLYAFTSVWMILFMILGFLTALDGVKPI